MRLTHFFQGPLRREEITSAFLAMVLEGVPKFRRYFFQSVLPDEDVSVSERQWDVMVEEDGVDVQMDAGDTIVLVENKVRPGAKQQGQLLRYYLRVRQKNPRVRVIAVYLAPRQVGQDEVARLRASDIFQSNQHDRAKHLSWEKLAEYPGDLDDIRDALVRSGLDEIERIINETGPIYPPEGERGIIRSTVDTAFNLLTEWLLVKRTPVTIRRWSGKEIEQIFTAGTSVSMWLDAVFEVEDEPPFCPINVRDEHGLIRITIRSQFKLAGKIKKTSALAQWWSQQMRAGPLEIPGVGPHCLQEDGWFVHTRLFSGTEESIATALAETGDTVLETLSESLSSAGFKLTANDKTGVV